MAGWQIAALWTVSLAAWAQGFTPSAPVELIVHSAPGGGSDVFAKAVVEMAQAEKVLVQPLRVVNHTAGASAQVEDVFMRGEKMPPFFDEQIDIMRRVPREAGVAVAQ